MDITIATSLSYLYDAAGSRSYRTFLRHWKINQAEPKDTLSTAAYRFIKMDIKKKNILTALILVAIAITIYVFAVLKAVSQ